MADNQGQATAGVPVKDAPVIRAAGPEEDDLLSRVLCNAFLPIWNHNWFHGVSQPLEPVKVGTISSNPPMNNLQRSRVHFYRALLKLTRLIGGSATVAEVQDSGDAMKRDIGAIILWLAPEKRLAAFDLFKLWQSGFLALMLPWHYGLAGFHRIEHVFEENIREMWARTLPDLPPHGFKEQDCAFVQMLASNPKYAGKGYASALLKHQCEQHFAEFPDVPVILDTTTKQGIRAYERLGFTLLAEIPVDTGTDAKGMRLTSNSSKQVKEEARKVCVQRVMAKLPGGS